MRTRLTYLSFLILANVLCTPLFAQIQTTAFSQPGFQDRIKSAVDSIWIVDTHEHLGSEATRIAKRDELDFTSLFIPYANDDLVSASNQRGLFGVIFGNDFSLEDRWALFEPFFQATRNTAYTRVPLIIANDLFGFSDINENTYKPLSAKVRAVSQPGWYHTVLRDHSRIDFCIVDGSIADMDTTLFRHVVRFDPFIMIASKAEIEKLCPKDPLTLENLVTALENSFQNAISNKMIGIKTAVAYERILHFENTSKETASRIFQKTISGASVEAVEIKALQDYMMHRMLDLAAKHEYPVQIHTGLHAGSGNYITNSNPTHLTNLFFEYPSVDFILFHSSYPYGGELSVLAKNFANVYIDMCWSHVISPSYSIRYLHEWLETVPSNKIMAFGGDYSFVEGVYAHAKMARQVVTRVLVEKVETGYLTEAEAIAIAERLLRTNALEVFKLKGHSRGLENIEALQRPGTLHDWWMIHKTDDGFIRNYQVIGPFTRGAGLAQVYPPEEEIDLTKSYTGLQGAVKWQAVHVPASGYLDFLPVFTEKGQQPTNTQGIAYAYFQLTSPDDRTVTLTLGSNDGAKLWVNGEAVYEKSIARTAVADQVLLSVKLKAGVNHLLAKVDNYGSNWGLYLRVVDPDNQLILP
jgi:uncharacterized protein